MKATLRAVFLMQAVLLGAAVQAATSISPNISGQWSGTVAGTDFHKEDNNAGGTDSTPDVKRVSASVTATLQQTGNDLTISAALHTNDNDTITVQLTGKAGDFAFWASGVHVDNDHTDQVFIAGQFDAKAKKIVGNMIFFHDRNVTTLIVSFKKVQSAALVRAASEPSDSENDSPAAASRDDVFPFNVVGSATGKSFTFGSNAKAITLKSVLNGTFTAENAATFTFVSSGETFTTSQFDAGKGLVFTGSSASSTILLSGTSGKSSAAGVGWIYNDTHVSIFKWSAKKQ